MDQKSAPLLEALERIEKKPLIGFGAPGHNQGAAMPSGIRALLGKRIYQADVLIPRRIDQNS